MISLLKSKIHSLFSAPSARRRRQVSRTSSVPAEVLEVRVVPAAVVGLAPMTPVLTNGILTVMGNDSGNTIEVTKSNGQIRVLGKSFSASLVKTIVLAGEGGDDTLTVSTSISIPAFIYGGSGADTIRGGNGRDTIYGGAGIDRIEGRGGDDQIYGGSGDDIINGGTGSDMVLDATSGDRVTSASTLVSEGSGQTAYSSSSFSGQVVSEVLRLVNAERKSRGLRSLTSDSRLAYVASNLSKQLRDLNVPVGQGISHKFSGTTGPTLSARLDANQIRSSSAAENNSWFKGNVTAKQMAKSMMDGLMKSSGHRANILNSTVTHLGLGLSGSSATGYYLTQVFVKFA